MLSVLVQAEFLDKLEGQKVHDSTKNANKISRMFLRNKFQQTAINSANMDKIKIMQRICRGLSTKISEPFVFLKEKYIDTVCLNEFKCWQN